MVFGIKVQSSNIVKTVQLWEGDTHFERITQEGSNYPPTPAHDSLV